MLKKIIISFGCALFVVSSLYAQQTIQGHVKDNNGNPLGQVTILNQDSSLIGSTDHNGYFLVPIADIPSFIILKKTGYTFKKVHVKQGQLGNIIGHKAGLLLSEVNVFGHFQDNSDQNKAFDIVHISGTKLINTFEPNPINALRARVPGLQMTATAGGVTSGSGMVIRGMKSVVGGNQPLFVLDGIAIENETSGANQYGGQDWGNSLKELNAYDIESIEVLKSAAAVYRYGSRGMNGVIEIKTKGENADLGFSVEANIGGSFGNSYGMPSLLDAATIAQINDSRLAWLGTSSQNYLNSFERANAQLGNVAISYANNKSKLRLSYTGDYNKGTFRRNTLDKNNLMFKFIHNWTTHFKTEVGVLYNNSIARNAPSIGAQKFASLGHSFIEYPIDFATATNNDPLESETAWHLYGQEAKKTAQSFRTYVQSAWQLSPAVSINFGGNFSDYGIRSKEQAAGYFERMIGNQSRYHQEKSYRNWAKEYTRDFMLKGAINFNKKVGEHQVEASLGYDYWQTTGGIKGYAYSPINANALLIQNGAERETIEKYFGSANYDLASWFDIKHANTKSIHAALASIQYKYGHNLYLSATGRMEQIRTLSNLDKLGKLAIFYPTAGIVYYYDDALRKWLNLPENLLSTAKIRANIGRTGNITGLYHYQSAVTDDMELPYPSHKTLYKPYYTNNAAWGMRNYQTGFSYEDALEVELGTNLRLFNDRIDLSLTWYSRQIDNFLYDIISPLNHYNRPLRDVSATVRNQGWEILLSAYPLSSPNFSWSSTINFAANTNKFTKIESSSAGDISLGTSQNDVSLLASVNGSFGNLMSAYAHKVDNQGQYLLNAAMEYVPVGESKLIGNATPTWIAGFENSFTYKNLTFSTLLDFKMGGDIYSGTYALLYQRGLLSNTAFGRSKTLGGLERKVATQQIDPETGNSNQVYQVNHDGIIPKGVFDQDVHLFGYAVGGLSFDEAQQLIGKDANGESLLQPLAASRYYAGHHDRSGVRDESIFKNSYIAIREITVGYTLPANLAKRWIGAKQFQLGLVGRNLGYIYKSLPYGLNPDAAYNNRSAGAFEYASLLPVRTFGMFMKLRF